MDLCAYVNSMDSTVDSYVKENYGEPPRYRGVRFMKTENPINFKPANWRIDEHDAGRWTRAFHPCKDWSEKKGFKSGYYGTTSNIFNSYNMYREKDFLDPLVQKHVNRRRYAWFYNDFAHPVSKSKIQFMHRRYTRFKDLENKKENESTKKQVEIFNSMCGKDVVQIHTRCGAYGNDDNEGSNYRYFEADKWEQNNPNFITSIDDGWDSTYRDHYFHTVKNEDYDEIIAMFDED